MKILIVGRMAAGKDTLARMLAEKGLRQVKSYTTRPKRYPEEDTHLFITQDEAKAIPGKLAETVINGYRYFTSIHAMMQDDVFIVNPEGVKDICRAMPETPFTLVYCYTDKETARQRAVNRAADQKAEGAIFDARYAEEEERFIAFEKEVVNVTDRAFENLLYTIRCHNETMESLSAAAETIAVHMRRYTNMLPIVALMCENGPLEGLPDGRVNVCRSTGWYPESRALVAAEMIGSEEAMAQVMIALSDLPDLRVSCGEGDQAAQPDEDTVPPDMRRVEVVTYPSATQTGELFVPKDVKTHDEIINYIDAHWDDVRFGDVSIGDYSSHEVYEVYEEES